MRATEHLLILKQLHKSHKFPDSRCYYGGCIKRLQRDERSLQGNNRRGPSLSSWHSPSQHFCSICVCGCHVAQESRNTRFLKVLMAPHLENDLHCISVRSCTRCPALTLRTRRSLGLLTCFAVEDGRAYSSTIFQATALSADLQELVL